jgi:hypothetical protein
MVEAQRHPQEAWGETDVTHIVRLLHHGGPLPLGELADDPTVAEWPAERVEQAIVSAWSRGLIFIDTRDLIVAL